jgi:phospholipase C
VVGTQELNDNLMPPGLDSLKHIVVLMMENRSFDHMLGALKKRDPRIDGLTGNESNPDPTGAAVKVQPRAEFQGQLDPDPDHHFPAVDLQIFNGDNGNPRVANMQGFVKSYYQQQHDVKHSGKIMYYFTPDKLPVLTTLATEFAVFNRWFCSIPGPTICNRAFAHYGTSFGQVSLNVFYVKEPYKSIYERLIAASPPHTAKIYYFDQASSTMEIVNLLQHQPQLFATYEQFIADCKLGRLPDYCFVEPNYNDHDSDTGAIIASDQHPDHHVQAGELFIASVYNAIKRNPKLWKSTALLVVYDEHGGIYDHVPPPPCLPDGFVAQPNDTGTGTAFAFDRLGVRVPAILISPWIPKGTVVDGRIFEHASIPATVTKFFLGEYEQRSPREKSADTFLDLLTLSTMRPDGPEFEAE